MAGLLLLLTPMIGLNYYIDKQTKLCAWYWKSVADFIGCPDSQATRPAKPTVAETEPAEPAARARQRSLRLVIHSTTQDISRLLPKVVKSRSCSSRWAFAETMRPSVAAQRRAERGDGKPDTFGFLGFTHICGRTKDGSPPAAGRCGKPKRSSDESRKAIITRPDGAH